MLLKCLIMLLVYIKKSYRDKLIASAYKNKALTYIGLKKFDKMRDNYIEALNYNKETELLNGFICYAKLFCADWNKLEYYKNLALQEIAENAVSPFCSFSITDDPDIQLKTAKLHCGYDKKINNTPYHKENYLKNTSHTNPRIAYLSYEKYHATMHLMAFFENQDHNKFDYYALSYTDKPDDGSIVYNRVRNSFKNFQLVTGKR